MQVTYYIGGFIGMISILLSPLTGSVASQHTTPPTLQPGHEDVLLGAILVNTFVTVVNKYGEPVTGLDATDFAVYDEGRRQRITAFSRGTELPLTLALVIDRSQSIQARFDLERAAAIHFLESVMRKGHDRALLAVFDSGLYIVHEFSDDVAALTERVKHLTTAGNSAIYDAVTKTVRTQFAPLPAGRHVMVLITDGEDTASAHTLRQAVDAALRADVIIYSIGIHATKSGAATLQYIARMTGGRCFLLQDPQQPLKDLFAQLQHELRSQYSIGYYLQQPPDGRFHRLTFKVKKKGLSVRARHGYYALAKP
ncbi:MAG: VWA domain-containing protein [Acidobacteriota bacterium]|nr:VWA domain-containing protein [Blastocatellia bacterium]MDW8238490.1 VWA domain-containing protein [Acidobacteriota bacterium]